MNPKDTRWCIASTGAIARVFTTCISTSKSGQVGSVLSRTQAGAEAFCADHGGTPCTDIDEALSDADAIYIATPHPMHAELAHVALERGVAVLCEKPMTCAATDTAAVVAAARRHGTPLIEAWMYRCHPQIEHAVQAIRAGAIGTPAHVEAHFGFTAEVEPTHRLRDPALGGGAILDIGGYVMSIAMLLAAGDDQFAVPTSMQASGTLDTTGVDADAHASLTFDGGMTAAIHASITEATGMGTTVHGDAGTLHLPCPFLPESLREGTRGTVIVNGEPTHVDGPMDCFSLEARALTACMAAGTIEPAWPMVTHDASIALAQALDEWRGLLLESTRA
ncbi:MAG: Gfo/Idh/MocA family oxidoreductase [Phycisphaerales bacterium]|nr:Gfo/Idh/MocA family oxidoreductase [Phycisphaerales bacterium]